MHLRGSDTAIINKATKQTAAHKRQGDVKMTENGNRQYGIEGAERAEAGCEEGHSGLQDIGTQCVDVQLWMCAMMMMMTATSNVNINAALFILFATGVLHFMPLCKAYTYSQATAFFVSSVLKF